MTGAVPPARLPYEVELSGRLLAWLEGPAG